jgi:hypothetical protein
MEPDPANPHRLTARLIQGSTAAAESRRHALNFRETHHGRSL